MPIEIAPLLGLPHLAPTLAAWHVAEWGHLYDQSVWNLEISVAEFEAMANGSTTDQTWVAFDGTGRADADVLGSVSLLATDDLPGFEHLTPWLASLFVAPQDARLRHWFNADPSRVGGGRGEPDRERLPVHRWARAVPP